MDALYESQRLGPGKAMGHAEICMPEFEKAGELVLDFASLFTFFFHFQYRNAVLG